MKKNDTEENKHLKRITLKDHVTELPTFLQIRSTVQLEINVDYLALL